MQPQDRQKRMSGARSSPEQIRVRSLLRQQPLSSKAMLTVMRQSMDGNNVRTVTYRYVYTQRSLHFRPRSAVVHIPLATRYQGIFYENPIFELTHRTISKKIGTPFQPAAARFYNTTEVVLLGRTQTY